MLSLLSEVSQLPLLGSVAVCGGHVALGLATVSTDHSGWNVASAPSVLSRLSSEGCNPIPTSTATLPAGVGQVTGEWWWGQVSSY